MFEREKKKEANYFDMFIESVEYACNASQKLLDLVRNYVDVENKAIAMHEIEHAGDIHFHALYEQLNRSFMTPIEREDILLIGQSIDDVTDLIEDIANRFVMFNIQKLRDDTIPFVELIVKACSALKIAVSEFKLFKKSKILASKIIELNDVEEEGDRYYMNAVRRLFTTEKDGLEILKWREIYQIMEDCLDACEEVADVLDGVILKNS